MNTVKTSSEESSPPVPTAKEGVRRNELWWQEQGGQPWAEEVSRRKVAQAHYSQQEALLLELFTALSNPVRALDFGCGFGRHLQNLKQLERHELFGCDISAKMLEQAAARIGDTQFAENNLKLIVPRGKLPFDDDFFDVSFTSEVLIHVDTADVSNILRELLRVTRSTIVHIENRPVSGSRLENKAHEGCWLHDFQALYRDLGEFDVCVLPRVVDHQCVYIVSKRAAALTGPIVAAAEARAACRLQELVDQSERDLHRARVQIRDLELELESSRREVLRQKLLLPAALERAAQGLPIIGGFVGGTASRAVPPPLPQHHRRASDPAPEFPLAVPDMSFARFAARASRPSPDTFIREQPEVVAICHPDWRGIRAATHGQSEHVLEIAGFVSDAHARRAAQFLKDCGTRRVVVNGFPPGSGRFARALRDLKVKATLDFVYHGTPAQSHFREDRVIDEMLHLADEKLVRKLGFVKHGLADYFRAKGYDAEFVMNVLRMPFTPANPNPGDDGRIHIGVFAPSICHKNVETQVLAALMIPDAIVHVCEFPPMTYLRELERIRVHGILPHAEFVGLLSRMHATLYVSLVECYPMTVLESLASGVVCVTSHSSMLFDDAPELFHELVVTNHDSPLAIARKVSSAIDRRSDLIPRAQAHVARLNRDAERRWREFLEA